jgi:hypothetical protein
MILICHRHPGLMLFSDLNINLHFLNINAFGTERKFSASPLLQAIPECGLFICLNPWESDDTWALVRGWQAPSIGLFEGFTVKIPLDFTKHSALLNFDFPLLFDSTLSFYDFADKPKLSTTAHEKAQKILNNLPQKIRLLAVHPETTKEKMWEEDKLTKVIDRFLDCHREFLVLILSQNSEYCSNSSHRNRVISCKGLALDVVYALLSHCDLFLGIDSCILHAADFLRIPGLALFGATDPNEFGFLLTPHRHVVASSMSLIETDEVYEQLESLWQENTKKE